MIDVYGSVELDLVKAFLRQIKPLLKEKQKQQEQQNQQRTKPKPR